MKKYLIIYALLTTALLGIGLNRYRREVARLTNNQHVLSAEVDRFRRRAEEEASSVEALQLRCSEFARLRADDARRIRDLGIRLRRVTTSATLAARQQTEAAAPLRDTVVLRLRDTLYVHDTVRCFRWNDRWCRIEGSIEGDSVRCRVESVDTLRQVVHRVPRRFLFIRWGTKAIRQEIVASNPHTRLVYAEYIEVQR